MKKVLCLLTAFSLIFLCGCMQKDLIDIYVFSGRFSRISSNFKIDTTNLIASEENGQLSFPIIFEDKILLTIYVNDETSLIKSVSITYLFEKNKSVSQKDFSAFCEIADCSIKAFTNIENTDEIFARLLPDKKENTAKTNHISFRKDFYDYSFVSTDVGFYLSATSRR